MCTTRGMIRLATWSICILLWLGTAWCSQKAEQVHISYGDAIDQIVVMWSTKETVTCSVQYGESRDQLTLTESSNVTRLDQYNQDALQFIYRAVLQNLKPKTQYFYTVVNSANGRHLASSVFSFTTLDSDTSKAVSFLVYGDLGVIADHSFKKLHSDMTTNQYDAVWHIGDFAYDMHSDGGMVGDNFMRALENISANIPYMVSPGNHEITFSQRFLQYRTRFSTPGRPWPIPLDAMWYSYNIGPVHFISYSTEVYFSHNQDYTCQQFDWLLNDLTEANRNREEQPWIIAVGHRPMYCSNSNWDDCAGGVLRGWVARGLDDLFHAQGVDIVIEAHEHSYERLYPMYKNQVVSYNYTDVNATVHLISGAAGNKEGMDSMSHNARPWSAYRHSITGDDTYGHLVVHNSSHVYWDQVRVKNGEVIDSIWVVKHHHGPFVPDVNCTGENIHPSCKCPPPIRYVTILACIGVALVLVIVASIVCCVKWRRRRRRRRMKANYREGSQDTESVQELLMESPSEELQIQLV